MADLKLSEVAAALGGTLADDRDPVITGVAGLDHAGPGDLTFVAKPGLLPLLAECAAAAAIVGPDMECELPAIRVAEPYVAFATVLARFAPDPRRVFPPGVHPTAVIASDADTAAAAAIGPYCVVGSGVTIGAGSVLGPHVILEADVQIGADCVLHARATVRECCRLGDRVTVHPGTVIGAHGFGYLPGPDGLAKIPQIGIVVVEDDVEIGANTCVDRATTGQTTLGRGSKLDNLVQIGHNVTVGKHCALSAQTGVSGSCVIGEGVTMGGRVGLADHLSIGDGAKLGGGSGVYTDVAPGQTVFGYPALPRAEAWRITAATRRLPDLVRKVAELERALARHRADQED